MTTPPARQRLVRVPGARRVQLTAVPGATAEPVAADEVSDAPALSTEAGPNDERLRRDVPPHY